MKHLYIIRDERMCYCTLSDTDEDITDYYQPYDVTTVEYEFIRKVEEDYEKLQELFEDIDRRNGYVMKHPKRTNPRPGFVDTTDEYIPSPGCGSKMDVNDLLKILGMNK